MTFLSVRRVRITEGETKALQHIMKSCFQTIKYKGTFIHLNQVTGLPEITEQVSVQFQDGTMQYPKTILGAKRLITKLLNAKKTA